MININELIEESAFGRDNTIQSEWIPCTCEFEKQINNSKGHLIFVLVGK